MPQMWEVIKAIEEAGIQVDRAYWEEDGHLEVDVNPADHEKAAAAVQEYWHDRQVEHLGLVAIPTEEGESNGTSQTP